MTGERGPILPDERRRLIAEALSQRGSVSVAWVQREFSVSSMTARRDLDQLDRRGLAVRTHGGAVLPSLSADEDSFQRRLEAAVDAKQRLAEAVLELVEPGEAIFVDSSTTAYFAARRIVRENRRCTLLTNGVAVMDLLCEVDAPAVEVVGVSGTLRKLTRSLVGPQAVHVIGSYFADQAIFSVRGISPEGDLTDPDPLEAEVKRAMIDHARQTIVLIDGSKLDRPALARIADLSSVGLLLAADCPEPSLRQLAAAGVEVRRV